LDSKILRFVELKRFVKIYKAELAKP